MPKRGGQEGIHGYVLVQLVLERLRATVTVHSRLSRVITVDLDSVRQRLLKGVLRQLEAVEDIEDGLPIMKVVVHCVAY